MASSPSSRPSFRPSSSPPLLHSGATTNDAVAPMSNVGTPNHPHHRHHRGPDKDEDTDTHRVKAPAANDPRSCSPSSPRWRSGDLTRCRRSTALAMRRYTEVVAVDASVAAASARSTRASSVSPASGGPSPMPSSSPVPSPTNPGMGTAPRDAGSPEPGDGSQPAAGGPSPRSGSAALPSRGWIDAPTPRRQDVDMVLQRCRAMQGYLWKQGGIRKNWKRRWFTFVQKQNTRIQRALGAGSRASMQKLYYLEKEATRGHLNYISIDADTRIEPSPLVHSKRAQGLGFCIVTEARTYYLVGESPEDKTQWMTTLRQVVVLLRVQAELERKPSLGASRARALGHSAARYAGAVDVVVVEADVSTAEDRECLSLTLTAVDPTLANFKRWESFTTSQSVAPRPVWSEDFSFAKEYACYDITFTIHGTKQRIVANGSLHTNAYEAELVHDCWIDLFAPAQSGLEEDSKAHHSHGEAATTTTTTTTPTPVGRLRVRLQVTQDARTSSLAHLGPVANPIPLRLDTGDVVLFSSDSAPAVITKLFTRSRWSHAAMVFRAKDGALYAVESTGTGVHVCTLASLWRRYHTDNIVAFVRLQGVDRASIDLHESLYEFIESVRGRPYEKKLTNLLKAVTHGPDRQAKEDLTSVFCSELIAAAYQRMGILPLDVSCGGFLPKHFGHTQRIPLIAPARLEDPRLFPADPEGKA